jgi:hypothetical protein
MKSIETQSSPFPTLLPFPLTEWLVPYAQTIAHDCFALFAFKGRNARHRKAIVLDVHSTPGALKEARRMCGNATSALHSLQGFNSTPQITTASLLSHTIIRCLLQDVKQYVSSLPHITRLVLMTHFLQAPVDCPVCHKLISRKADFPRHMRTHAKNKEAL